MSAPAVVFLEDLHAIPEQVDPAWVERVRALVLELDARLLAAEPQIFGRVEMWEVR